MSESIETVKKPEERWKEIHGLLQKQYVATLNDVYKGADHDLYKQRLRRLGIPEEEHEECRYIESVQEAMLRLITQQRLEIETLIQDLRDQESRR